MHNLAFAKSKNCYGFELWVNRPLSSVYMIILQFMQSYNLATHMCVMHTIINAHTHTKKQKKKLAEKKMWL